MPKGIRAAYRRPSNSPWVLKNAPQNPLKFCSLFWRPKNSKNAAHQPPQASQNPPKLAKNRKKWARILQKVLPTAKSGSELIFESIFSIFSIKTNAKNKRNLEANLKGKLWKNNVWTKCECAENTVKTIVPSTFFKNHSQREKRNQTEKSCKKVWKNNAKQTKKTH